MLYGITALRRQQVVVDKGLGALGGEFHHHTGWRVGIHIRILTGDIVILDIDDVEKNITCLCLTGNGTLVAVSDISLCHILTGTLHQLHLNGVLNLLHRHLGITLGGNTVGNGLQQTLIFSLVRMKHRLTDSSHDFLFVESHNTPIALYNSLYHIIM